MESTCGSSDPDCELKGIPRHLHQLGRPADQEFESDEALYRRSDPATRLGEAVPYEVFTTRRMSVNRQKYSNGPEDVLFNIKGPPHYSTWGIVEIQMGVLDTIRIPHPQVPDREYTVRVAHRPELCMYPHCEIELYENGRLVAEIKPSSVKTMIKKAMAQSAIIRKFRTAKPVGP